MKTFSKRSQLKRVTRPEQGANALGWTFLSNHAHVLVCVARDPTIRLREVALLVGITERGVQKIIGELVHAGVVEKSREGRRSRYTVRRDLPLRHPIEASSTVGELLEATAGA